ncbi:DNA primase [Solibacillus sp. FSL W7-1436]|uniref:DNA primase n=1 Tax=Solibacillus sp. FSL W7-1436 TaxID=2921705 RepID=UPI0030FCAF2C
MIRSVGTGSSSLNNQTRPRNLQQQTTAFPKIGEGQSVAREQEKLQTNEAERGPIMVGVKPKAQLKSIFDEPNDVVKLNADGDKLEVSKRAISLAKEVLYI